MSALATAGIQAAKWSAVTTLARFGLQLIGQIILARILGPDIYGLFGMGLVFFAFSNFLATFGFSWSLAQLREISDEDIRFAFTWQMIVGAIACLILLLAAPLIADYFHDQRVLSIVRWMALNCLLNAAGSVAGNLMRRSMNFRAIGSIQLASYFIGYILIGIPAAMMGGGVGALIAAWMVQSAVVLAASYYGKPHSLKPLFKAPQSAEMVRIGSAVFFTNLGNWLINNIDRIMIGRLLNAHAMGVYTVGYNLANMPNTLLLGALQPVFLAAGARVQDDLTRMRNAYRQVSAAIWVLLLPMFVLLAILSPEIIKLLYGPVWADASGVVGILFLAMPAFVTWGMSTPVLWNTQRPRHELLLQLPLIPLAALAFYFLGSGSVMSAALVAAGILALRGIVIATAASRILTVGLSAWADWLARGLVFSAVVIAAVLLVQKFLPLQTPTLLRLLIASFVALLACIALVMARPRLVGNEAASLLLRFAPRLSGIFSHLSVKTA